MHSLTHYNTQYNTLYCIHCVRNTSTMLYICKDYVLNVRKDKSACITQCIVCQCITFVFGFGVVLLMSRTV